MHDLSVNFEIPDAYIRTSGISNHLKFHYPFYNIVCCTIIFNCSTIIPCDLATAYCKPIVSIFAEGCACIKYSVFHIPPCTGIFCECYCLKVYNTLLYVEPCTTVFIESCVIPCYFSA